MLKKLIILGAGGNAADILDIVAAINARRPTWDVLGLLDDSKYPGIIYGHKIVGALSDALHLPVDLYFVNAVGGDRSSQGRQEIIARTRLPDQRFATLVHPQASIAEGVSLGAGSYACFGVSVGRGARVGRHVHLGVHAIIGHDAVVGDYSMIAPAAIVSGFVQIDNGCYIGAGARLKQYVAIGSGALVGMAAVVVKDVAPWTTVVGNPARAIVKEPSQCAGQGILRTRV